MPLLILPSFFTTLKSRSRRLDVEWHIKRGATILDLGCGSGLLGLAALGDCAGRLVALDNDSQAVLATQINIERPKQVAISIATGANSGGLRQNVVASREAVDDVHSGGSPAAECSKCRFSGDEDTEAAISRLSCLSFIVTKCPVPERSEWRVVSVIFEAILRNTMQKLQRRLIAGRCRPKLPKFAIRVDETEPEVLVCMRFIPQLRSTHQSRSSAHNASKCAALSRHRPQVRRAIVCLGRAILLEHNEDCAVHCIRYMTWKPRVIERRSSHGRSGCGNTTLLGPVDDRSTVSFEFERCKACLHQHQIKWRPGSIGSLAAGEPSHEAARRAIDCIPPSMRRWYSCLCGAKPWPRRTAARH